jgi:hypothetical protein
MPVFRYDTRDVVRKLADEELSCSLAGTPATLADPRQGGPPAARRRARTVTR